MYQQCRIKRHYFLFDHSIDNNLASSSVEEEEEEEDEGKTAKKTKKTGSDAKRNEGNGFEPSRFPWRGMMHYLWPIEIASPSLISHRGGLNRATTHGSIVRGPPPDEGGVSIGQRICCGR